MTQIRVEGLGGQITYGRERIQIVHEDSKTSTQSIEIDLQEVDSVEFKKAGTLRNGHIKFVVPGGERKNTLNAMAFTKLHNEEFAGFHTAIMAALEERDRRREELVSGIIPRAKAEEAEQEPDKLGSLIASLERKGASAIYAGHIVDYKGYRYGLGSKTPIVGAVAEYESGADRGRPTLTRIGAGAILAGPVGAVAGGMFKKDKSKGYVTILFPNDATVIIDGPIKDEKKMRQFAQQVNKIAAAEAKREGVDVVETPAEQMPIADQLLKLKELHTAGVLTDEQYEEKSSPLISQL